jgi:hypothetical protein
MLWKVSVLIKISMSSAEPLRRDCKSTVCAVHFNCKRPSVYPGPKKANIAKDLSGSRLEASGENSCLRYVGTPVGKLIRSV